MNIVHAQRTVRVTKRFSFEMAHALHGHDGDCAGIHGHSYVLDITLRGVPSEQGGDPKYGMVIDFADLKVIVQRAVLDHYDHALVLHQADSEALRGTQDLWRRLHFKPWQPTCELLLLDIVERLSGAFNPNVQLYSARLQETATSWSEWTAADN